MRAPSLLVLLAAAAPLAHSQAQQLEPAVKQVQVKAKAGVADLSCESRAGTVRPPAPPNPDPMEVPTDEMVQSAADEAPAQASAEPVNPVRAGAMAGGGYRIAIWGDSHLAAGFFSEELARQLKYPTDSASNVLLPANMGRPGVRLPIRRTCVSSQWKYEPGYLGGDNAAAPGPGLVNMFSEQAGATLAWDLRPPKLEASYHTVRILYQQTETPLRVAIGIDGEPETELTLDQRAGPAVLELVSEQPLTQLRLRLLDGRFRLHGLELRGQGANAYQMDVFGYPGATVAAWKSARLDYLRSWFSQRDYQLVMLEFGTNEGNVKPFDIATYRKSLTESVQNMRSLFPNAACLLVAPGDRGVLVPRSLNHKVAGKQGAKGKAKGNAKGKAHLKAKVAPRIDLYQYSRIHAAIAQAQREVGAQYNCSAWSMLDAMGGPGSAYTWARQSPALMARDLIHFTVPGYQRLAQKLAKDMGWLTLAPEGQ